MVALNSMGLGYTVDLGGFDRAVGIESTPARLEIFDGRGSFFHTAFGVVAGMLPAAWPTLTTSAFGAYQLSKVEGGKPFPQIAGAMLEFAIGMGLAALLMMRAK
jgi:hypothetical protein